MLETDFFKSVEAVEYKTGKGKWHGFQLPLRQIAEAAKAWAKVVEGHDKLWLCWNVDPQWNLVQQRMALAMGWTPLVGGDPRAEKPTILPGSLFIDFNKDLNLPMVHMLFAVEFAFLYIPGKLAFWHSDLLVRKEKLQFCANLMEGLRPGDMLVTRPGRGMKQKLLGQQVRYWELLACTTKEASAHQFQHGAGWFGNIAHHPMTPSNDVQRRAKLYYDHGSGIHYWAHQYKPDDWIVGLIEEEYLDEGHCTRIRKANYKTASPNNDRRNLSSELSLNYNLIEECQKLGLTEFLTS